MRSLLSIALIAALAACTAERAPTTTQGETPADAVGEASPAPPPSIAETPAPSVPAATPDGDLGMATFAGYGDVRFGTLAADMGKAWGGELKELGKDYNASCYFMTPVWVKTPAEFNFMIGEGKFVRYGSDSAKIVAPGGGKVGVGVQELQALYHGALQSDPHKYVEGGQTLSLSASGVAPAKLVFEVDAAGKVTAWRVGLAPQVDYVEGCS